MQYINAPNIILGIANPLDPDNTNNPVILILKYYLYKCRCLGDKPSINGSTKYLKYCIKIEQITINVLFPTKKEYICKKLLIYCMLRPQFSKIFTNENHFFSVGVFPKTDAINSL
jgi:hypothetical protein